MEGMDMSKKFDKWKAQSLGDKTFDIVNYTLLTLSTLICLYPLYYIVMVSFSESPYGVYLLPNGFTTIGYKTIMRDKELWIGYRNTIFYTVGGVLFSLVLTVPCGYALSRKDLPGKSLFTKYMLISMFFSGGMIPSYLNVRNLHLLDTWGVVIIMTGVSIYNIIMARTFFTTNIPDELFEAATMDGCGNGRFLLKIVMPLSKPITAVLALWIGVGRWNSYMTEMLYLRDSNKYPLAMYLRKTLWQVESLKKLILSGQIETMTEETMEQLHLASIMQYVIIIFATAPLLAVYPFIQKYFAKGVMIGAVKG